MNTSSNLFKSAVTSIPVVSYQLPGISYKKVLMSRLDPTLALYRQVAHNTYYYCGIYWYTDPVFLDIYNLSTALKCTAMPQFFYRWAWEKRRY